MTNFVDCGEDATVQCNVGRGCHIVKVNRSGLSTNMHYCGVHCSTNQKQRTLQ